jgi:hypothetical protein
MKIKIRKAKISDIPSLVEKMQRFYELIREKGASDVAKDNNILKGGIVIEVGNGFCNPNWLFVVATKDSDVIGFIIAITEFCSPVSEYHKCIKIHADYQESDTLIGPKILLGMWGIVEDWAKENNASYYYANVHPGNQSSVRAVKHIGFKHKYTQFHRLVELEKKEEEVS